MDFLANDSLTGYSLTLLPLRVIMLGNGVS